MTARSLLRRCLAVGLLCAATLPLGLPAASARPPSAPVPQLSIGPARLAELTHAVGPLGSVRSKNWAGYVDKGHAFTYVKASWVVPRVSCTRDDSVATFWVGLDGYSSKTVEQAGTMAYCHGGRASYYTWWEMYPTTDAQIVGSSVKPGDTIIASVSLSGHKYTMHVVDATTKGNTFTKHSTCASCDHASVEWIVERPDKTHGIFPLAKFEHLTFYASRVGVGKTRGTISKFAHDAVTMVNRGGQSLARVSALQRGGNRFVATWLRMQ